MANKKKPTPKPLVTFLHVDEYNNCEKARTAYWQYNAKDDAVTKLRNRLKAEGDTTREADLELIQRFLLSERTMLCLIGDLYGIMEDPAVAHAVAVKEQLEKLARQLEDLQSDLNSHERSHKGDDYY